MALPSATPDASTARPSPRWRCPASYGMFRAGYSTRSPLWRCAGAICRRSLRGCCGSSAPARRKRRGRRPAPCARSSGRPSKHCSRWSARQARTTSSIVSAISMSTPRAESLAKDRFARDLRRENGVEIDEFDADELRQLEPALSRDYVRGVLVRENGHTSNPLALVERLVEQFVRSGGELVRARAHGFRLEGGRLAAIETDTRGLPSGAAVVWAG